MSRFFCRSCATMHAASLPRASACYILGGAKQYEQNCLRENMSLAARHDKKNLGQPVQAPRGESGESERPWPHGGFDRKARRLNAPKSKPAQP